MVPSVPAGPTWLARHGSSRTAARRPPPRLGRRLSRPRHGPDDGRNPEVRARGEGVPGQPDVGVSGPPPVARRVDRVQPARPDPAGVLVPGRGELAVLARRPAG